MYNTLTMQNGHNTIQSANGMDKALTERPALF